MANEYRRLEAERLRERIAVLESDRSRLMASIRHMRQGRLDESYLSDRLRLELAEASSYGVLLETIEVESRCLQKCLAEVDEAERLDDEPDFTTRALRQWQELDRRLNRGKLDGSAVAQKAIESGLARRVTGPLSVASAPVVWTIEPACGPNLVPGPLLLVAFEDGAYGGSRLYRPVGDELRIDTGAFGG